MWKFCAGYVRSLWWPELGASGCLYSAALSNGAGGLWCFPVVESGEDYVNVPESEENADASLGEWLVSPAPSSVAMLYLRVLTTSSVALSPSVWVSFCLPFGMAAPPSHLSLQMGVGSM